MKFASMDESRGKARFTVSKLAFVLLLCSYFHGSTALHFQHLQTQPVNQANVYNKNLYLAELSNIQSRLSNGLQAVKDKFTAMNQ